MSFFQPFRFRLPVWADWLALVLMSFAAPLLAAWIHSFYVFEYGFRFYNAEIGGIYFRGSMPPYSQPGLSFTEASLVVISGCSVPAVPTFLVLLLFRKRVLHRWLVWAGFVILWTGVLFQLEIAIA